MGVGGSGDEWNLFGGECLEMRLGVSGNFMRWQNITKKILILDAEFPFVFALPN